MKTTAPTTESYLLDLQQELQWLRQLIEGRRIAEEEGTTLLWEAALDELPDLSRSSEYGRFVNEYELQTEERLALILAMAPYLEPNLLARLHFEGNPGGLARSSKNLRFAPSGDTLWFLLQMPGTLIHLQSTHLFGSEHPFYQKGVLYLDDPEPGYSIYSGMLTLHAPYRELFLHNRPIQPRLSAEFPAKLLTTQLEWDDLVLTERTIQQLEEIVVFHQQEEALRNDPLLGRHLKPGYRAIFAGASGVGKTLSAALLGKRLNLPVYRVDLSQIVSKYIGETSKNLDKLFNLAEDQGWMLFFDEGDALFGKRVNTAENDHKNAQYANQEIAYLLQRIEDYNGLVLVATNKPNNIDDAFGRRFQNKIVFDVLPDDHRLEIWKDLLTREFKLAPDVNLAHLNKLHRFTMANMFSIVARVTMLCRHKGLDTIPFELLRSCAMDEKMK